MFKKLKWRLKKYFKKPFWQNFTATLLTLYLKIVYKTSRWQFNYQNSYSESDFKNSKNTIFVFWHNRLTFGLEIFKNHQDIYAIVSPHSDGMIIGKIVSNFGFKILAGSSNKNSVTVLQQIIKRLKNGSNIALTPDGPRGPAGRINSSVTQIAAKYGAGIVPISCYSSNFFLLKTWDKLIMPLPFGNICVNIGAPLKPANDKKLNDLNLEQQLNILSEVTINKKVSE